jgi:hypothetical protein
MSEPRISSRAPWRPDEMRGSDILLEAEGGRLRAGEVFMDEPSVMATENALMAAALTPGTTVIGTRRASRTCRTSPGCSSAWGRRSTASARTG